MATDSSLNNIFIVHTRSLGNVHKVLYVLRSRSEVDSIVENFLSQYETIFLSQGSSFILGEGEYNLLLPGHYFQNLKLIHIYKQL